MAKTNEQLIEESIIAPYRELSGNNSIPKDNQYWTTDVIELQILRDEQFITKSQFNTFSCKDWFKDITDTINDGRKKFNPDIVHLNNTTIRSFIYLHSLLLKLTHNAKKTMVAYDFVIGKKYIRSSGSSKYSRKEFAANAPIDVGIGNTINLPIDVTYLGLFTTLPKKK